MKCQRCGRDNPANNLFCLACGTRIEPPECPKCGLKNAAGAEKCALCDAPLGNPVKPISESEPEVPAFSDRPEPAKSAQPGGSSSNRSLLVWVLVAFIAGAVAFVYFRQAAEPPDPLKAPPAGAALPAENPNPTPGDPNEVIVKYVRDISKILKANITDCEKAVQEVQLYAERNKAAYQDALAHSEKMQETMSADENRAYEERLMKNMESMLKETLVVMTEFYEKCPDAAAKLDVVLGK